VRGPSERRSGLTSTVEIQLAYGKNGLYVDLPENVVVIEPDYLPALPDETGALKTAIRNPLSCEPLMRSVKKGQTVGISVCDITRPMPNNRVIPVILNELSHLPPEDITIFIATGTHRSNDNSELESMLGTEVVNYGCRIINHDAFDTKKVDLVGQTTKGIPILINKNWLECDFKITTGFVEPHFFAGFSGGPKMIAPGLAGFETIMNLHNAEMIANPNSRWGVTEGNPIHDSIREIAEKIPSDFSLDVTINKQHGITSVYAGNMFDVHRAACRFAKGTAMKKVDKPFDLVVTTNSGYPLDMNLYQTVKGMSAASQIVRNGGAIICASECSDGIPNHGLYKELLSSRSSPRDLLNLIESPGHDRHDQWQVQIQAQIQIKSDVYLKSDNLTPDQIRAAHLQPIDDISETVRMLAENKGNAICVLPEGPQTIPYIS